MLSKRTWMAVGGVLLLACSSGESERSDGGVRSVDSGRSAPGDDRLIVPESIVVSALSGGNGVLELQALTLREGPMHTEIYAALKNVGDEPACDASFSVELFDTAQLSVAAGISGLFTQRFYRLTDGSETLAACVGPGDVTMAAITDLPAELAIEDVGFIVYRCSYFALEVAPVDGIALDDVRAVARGEGTAYTGTFVNGLEVAVSHPSVTVFPTTRAGRPLGAVEGKSMEVVSPGGRWAFETSATDVAGVDFAAYPAAALAR